MTADMIDLARRAVACKGWRWMPGMLFVNENGTRIRFVVELGTHAIGMVQGGGHPSWRELLPLAGVLPDLTDPATLGCLLALVREAWRCAMITSPDYDYDEEEARQGETVIGWRAVETVRWMTVGEGDTEAEALVAALEAAA